VFEVAVRVCADRAHHDQFRAGVLVARWAEMYPMLFDEDDVRIAGNQAAAGYHFFEWLAAIQLYHAQGLLSLVEQYQFANHTGKRAKLAALAAPEVIEFMIAHPEFGGHQCPDLLIYRPDMSDWFFCEVKGPTDSLSDGQARFFDALSQLSGKPVRLAEVRYLDLGTA